MIKTITFLAAAVAVKAAPASTEPAITATGAAAPATTAFTTFYALNERDCYITTIFGGQVPITSTICDRATKCSVCVGCNAPVTVCS